MLKHNQIFIHVPKTGGTTLNCALHGTENPQDNSFNFRHIVYETKLSTSGDIFNPLKNDKYQRYKIFMMLRHPVDRLLSEYYFIKERDEFFSLLKPSPKNFEEYALHPQTANYVVSFLLGNKMYDKKRPTDDDLSMVKNAIQALNITIGIYENFRESLALFQKKLSVDWPKTIENKRVTIIRPKKEAVSTVLFDKIMTKHHLDVKLYRLAQERFAQEENFGKLSSKIKENRFDYVLTYTNSHFLLELVLKGHPFIATHKNYFNALRKHLADLKLNQGEEYLHLWKQAFEHALEENTLPEDLSQLIAANKVKHPMDFIQEFGNYIQYTNAQKLKKIHLEFKPQHLKAKSIISRIMDSLKRFG